MHHSNIATSEQATTHNALLTAPNHLALYIHLPWCIKKCPYCDFNSHTGAVRSADYVTALLQDLDFELTAFPTTNQIISSIFFGGGTPSLFPAEDIAAILQGCAERLNFSEDIEITLEANPGAAEQNRFQGYHAAGVNRLSIGVQSFADKQLQQLGRIHSAKEAKQAYAAARAAGFDNINLDLMYALPQQNVAEALSDLEQAIALAPEHISHYQLTLEPGTVFANKPPPVPDDETTWDMQQTCQDRLDKAGYQQYEVSAYAQPKRECQHNLNYWRFGDYLGIGAGAHGKLTTQTNKATIIRRARRPHPANYMQTAGSAAALQNNAVVSDPVGDFMLNAVRLQEGFTRQQFEQTTGHDWADIESIISRLIQLELLQTSHASSFNHEHEAAHKPNQHIKPTALGFQHLNRILLEFT